MKRILIADASEEFRMSLAEQLRKNYVVECRDNGDDALEFLRGSRPDVLILDLMLPGIDGLGILQAADQEGIRPITIVTSRFFSDYLIGAMSHFRVDYAVVKPCRDIVLVQRVDELVTECLLEQPGYPSAESVVTTQMYDLGMPSNLAGFAQARMGIMMLTKDPGQSITKELYPAIAAQSEQRTSAGSVERNIRTAINAAWCRHNEEVWRRYFPATPDGHVPKPTNTQFLTRLADSVSQRLKKWA